MSAFHPLEALMTFSEFLGGKKRHIQKHTKNWLLFIRANNVEQCTCLLLLRVNVGHEQKYGMSYFIHYLFPKVCTFLCRSSISIVHVSNCVEF